MIKEYIDYKAKKDLINKAQKAGSSMGMAIAYISVQYTIQKLKEASIDPDIIIEHLVETIESILAEDSMKEYVKQASEEFNKKYK